MDRYVLVVGLLASCACSRHRLLEQIIRKILTRDGVPYEESNTDIQVWYKSLRYIRLRTIDAGALRSFSTRHSRAHLHPALSLSQEPQHHLHLPPMLPSPVVLLSHRHRPTSSASG